MTPTLPHTFCRWMLTLLATAIVSTAIAQQSLDNLRQQRQQALDEIARTTRQLNEANQSAGNSLTRLKLLADQLAARRRMVAIINQENEEIDRRTQQLNSRIDKLKNAIDRRKTKYARSLRSYQYRRSVQHRWLFILSADNFMQSIRRLRYLRQYAQWQKNEARQLANQQQLLAREQAELQRMRSEKNSRLAEREAEQRALQDEERLQQDHHRQIEQTRHDLQAQLAQKKKQAEELDRQIDRLIAREAERAAREAEQLARNNKKNKGKPNPETRTAETAGGYAMTKAERKLSGDFAANRGRLPYPVQGRYRIADRFGEHPHPQWQHVRINNNGIDIEVPSGTEALAVFNGTVTGIFSVPGYHNGIIVRHGNYLTIYANIAQVYVRMGDAVTARQELGSIAPGTDGTPDTSILHFEIRHEKEKLNPEHWLQ